LSFAGHTHGGKIRLPLVGTMLVPSRFGRFLDYGWFQKADCRMFITKGIGYFPGLFGRQGEVLKIRLIRSE
jgi:predicted MPP superfamily phosphohydrolase